MQSNIYSDSEGWYTSSWCKYITADVEEDNTARINKQEAAREEGYLHVLANEQHEVHEIAQRARDRFVVDPALIPATQRRYLR